MVEEPIEDGQEVELEETPAEEVVLEEAEDDKVIEELTAKLQEEENKRLRLLADYENFKRRATLDKEALQKYRSQNVVNEFNSGS